MKILITGATGFVGGHTVKRLLEKGHDVYCLVRSEKRAAPLKELGAKLLLSDLTNLSESQIQWPELDAVIHLAGLIKAKKTKEFYDVNVGGTETLIKELQKHCPQVKSFVHVSSLAARGPNHSHKNFASDGPISEYGKSKYESEDAVINTLPTEIVSIIRPPVVYGPGDTATLPLFKMFKSGFFPTVGKGEHALSFVYVEDLADVLVHAVENPQGYTPLHPEDGAQGHTWNDVFAVAEKTFGKKIWSPSLPFWLVKTGAILTEFTGKVFRFTPNFSRDKYQEMRQKYWTCESEKLRHLLTTNLEYGFKKTKDWYETKKWL